MIERANLGAFALELGGRLRRDPAAHEMWFEVGLSFKKAPNGAMRDGQDAFLPPEPSQSYHVVDAQRSSALKNCSVRNAG
jgi:hypothetical protein